MAHILPHNAIRRMRGLNPPQEAPSEAASEPAKTGPEFYVSLIDIIVSRAMLMRAKRLPPDVVDNIFDYAEYWAHSSNEFDYQKEHGSALKILGTSVTQDRLLLRSFPVGLMGIGGEKALSEVLAYDINEAKPHPLTSEHDPAYFAKLAKYPTPGLVNPVRKIVFTIKSKDQGWGGEPGTRHTYKSSWTWFEAGLERFDANQKCDPLCIYDVRHQASSSVESPLPICSLRPIIPEIEQAPHDGTKYKYKHPLNRNSEYEIQRNKTAHKGWNEYVVTWLYTDNISPDSDEAKKIDEEEGRGRGTLDGSYVRNLKLGDVITVWGKARFGGWANHVEKVKIDVYWAV